MMAVIMALLCMPSTVIAADEKNEIICGDDCNRHDHKNEEPGDRNILCLFGHSWSSWYELVSVIKKQSWLLQILA